MKSLVAVVLGTCVLAACTAGAVPARVTREPATPSPSPRGSPTDTPQATEPTPTATPSPSPTRTPYPTGEPATVLREIDVGNDGWAMTLAGESLLVQVDPPTDAIVRIDVESGKVTPVVPRGWRARSGPEGVWVVGESFLFSVDPATGGVLARSEVRGHFTLADGFVWVLNENGLHGVKPDTGAVATTIVPKARLCNDVKDLAIGFGSAWAACKQGAVNRVDLATGAVTEIPTGAGTHTFHVGGEAIWVTNYQAGSTSRIDPATNTVVNIPGVGSGIGITEGGGLVWAATNSQLVGLDEDGSIKRRLAVPGAHFWYDLIWTDDGIWGSTAGPSVYLIDVPELA